MKKLTVNGAPLITDEDDNPVLAACIERDGDTITGYDADGTELFALRGINPTATIEVEDETGAPSDFDATPEDDFRAAVQAATTLDELKAALLGTAGPGAEPRRPGR